MFCRNCGQMLGRNEYNELICKNPNCIASSTYKHKENKNNKIKEDKDKPINENSEPNEKQCKFLDRIENKLTRHDDIFEREVDILRGLTYKFENKRKIKNFMELIKESNIYVKLSCNKCHTLYRHYERCYQDGKIKTNYKIFKSKTDCSITRTCRSRKRYCDFSGLIAHIYNASQSSNTVEDLLITDEESTS